MTTPDAVEVEWQFDALDLRPVERWLAALPQHAGSVFQLIALSAVAKPPRRLFDTYLDTDDWRFGRAGYVLRVRRRGRMEEATIKDNRPADTTGLRSRLEVSEPLGPGGITALDETGPVGRRVRALGGRASIRTLLEVRTRRRPFILRIDGVDVAEVALDDTVITGGGERPVHLRRVEVEVAGDRVDDLRPLVAHLRDSSGLRAATLSKFEAGLLGLGIAVPGPPDLGPATVSRDATLGDVAFAVLRRHCAVLFAKEPGTRVGDDIEELHEMRVATRRLRAAIDFFSGVLPARFQSLRVELGWIADVLGDVRDLDVQLERMERTDEWTAGWQAWDIDTSALDGLRALLVAQRTTARRRLLAAFDSRRWERLVAALTATVARGPNQRLASTRAPAVTTLPELVDIRHRAALRAARRARRSGVAADYHRLRIRCKRLRYSLEFTSGVYGGKTDRFTKRLAGLQDALGLMQDAEVAMLRLLSLAAANGDVEGGLPSVRLPETTVFMMGAVAERYRVETVELLATMRSRLSILDDRQWRALTQLMENRRDESLAAMAVPAPSVSPLHHLHLAPVVEEPGDVDSSSDDSNSSDGQTDSNSASVEDVEVSPEPHPVPDDIDASGSSGTPDSSRYPFVPERFEPEVFTGWSPSVWAPHTTGNGDPSVSVGGGSPS